MNFELFSKIISINSIYPNEQELGDYIYTYMNTLWFKVEKQFISSKYCENQDDEKRFNILAEKWNGMKSLLFYAHMDTVPVCDSQLWQSNPFELVQNKINSDNYNWLWVVDMKWWLFAILEAIKDINPVGYKIKIVFWCDEEYWSKWAYSLVDSDFLNDVVFGIVPEIWDSMEWRNSSEYNILLWRRWRYLLKLEIPWKSCHWAMAYKLWINAITQASVIVQEIDTKFQITKKHNYFPYGNQFVKYISSETSSLSVPDNAIIYIDRHVLPWETPEIVLQETQDFINNLYKEQKLNEIEWQKIKISFFERPTPASNAYEVRKDNKYLKEVENSVLKYYSSFKYWYWSSVADENVIVNNKNIPLISLGPIWWKEHSANEWVSISSIEKLIWIYKDLMTNFKI